MLPITPRPTGSDCVTAIGVIALAEAMTCCCRLSVVNVTADSEDSERPESVTMDAITACASRSEMKVKR